MKIVSPEHAYRHFKRRIRSDVEEFWIAALDSDKGVLASACLFRGTVDHCLFHPRDVFRFAFMNNASAFVVAHNHPSGNILPSAEDVMVTEQLLTISIVMQIQLVDHLILARGKYFSFLKAGQLKTEVGKSPV